ncbi:MAG: hypothetical protein IJJ61_06445 [Clostridia bacterium]|nr:hypothetical protein [Clostridia bacterium]
MKNTKIQITLPPITLKKLSDYSRKTGLKMSAAITALLMLAFESLQTTNIRGK